MITKPKIERRKEQHTVGIRTRVPMRDFPKIIPAHHREVFAFLKARSVTPAGPPFIRYHVIAMDGVMDVEVGVPVAKAMRGNGRIIPGVLPAGRYATLIYKGLDGLPGNKALIEWAKKNRIAWDRWDDPKGDAFRCRYESYLTDPAKESDTSKWETEVAIKLTDR